MMVIVRLWSNILRYHHFWLVEENRCERLLEFFVFVFQNWHESNVVEETVFSISICIMDVTLNFEHNFVESFHLESLFVILDCTLFFFKGNEVSLKANNIFFVITIFLGFLNKSIQISLGNIHLSPECLILLVDFRNYFLGCDFCNSMNEN